MINFLTVKIANMSHKILQKICTHNSARMCRNISQLILYRILLENTFSAKKNIFNGHLTKTNNLYPICRCVLHERKINGNFLSTKNPIKLHRILESSSTDLLIFYIIIAWNLRNFCADFR